ncbi:MAG: hypothetical protein ABS920_13925, partial [Sporosarcina sp.]
AIVTLVLPEGFSAIQLGDNLFLNGFNVHYESNYLRERNWLQISCMNEVTEKELDRLLRLLPLLTSMHEQVFTTASKGKTDYKEGVVGHERIKNCR